MRQLLLLQFVGALAPPADPTFPDRDACGVSVGDPYGRLAGGRFDQRNDLDHNGKSLTLMLPTAGNQSNICLVNNS